MKKRWWVIVLLGLLMGLFFVFDLGRFFSLEVLKESHNDLQQAYQESPLYIIGIYSLTYIVMAALSLPGAAVMSLAGGAMFGLWVGVPIVLVSATIGATLAFWVARYVLRDTVQRRFGDRLETINSGLERDGAFYLFSLRLVPVFPFFLINLLMGLTKIRSVTFFWASLVGMFAGSAVYVNAGTQLASLTSLSDILSPALIGSFVLLATFPWLARWGVGLIKTRRIYARWTKPKQFDRNLVVIGGGAAGLVTSYIAAVTRAKVTLIEGHKMGGDCLNTGCVPSKSLLHASKLAHVHKVSSQTGVTYAAPNIDFKAVMAQVHKVIKTIEPHDSIERYESLGVKVVTGNATIVSPWQVDIQTEHGLESLTTKNIVIATGASAFVPPIPGLKDIDYLTAENLWELTEQPKRLVVLGGGPIGSELSQAFGRLGTQVTQVEMLPQLLAKEDSDAAQHLYEQLIKDGVDVRLNTKAIAIESSSDKKLIVLEKDGNQEKLEFDQILVAVGRQANLTGFGLEELGIETNKTLITNQLLQTKYPNILAAGDVAGPYQFTHTASHQAWYAAVNALFRPFKTFKVDYRVIPWATFTDPEIATVGLNETAAKEQNIDYEVTRYDIGGLDRALADDHARGFVKVLTLPGKDKILGATIVGAHAGELLAEFVLAMKYNLGMNKLLGTIHIYPTMAEATKNTAGVWKKAHAPEKLLSYVEGFHKWRRS